MNHYHFNLRLCCLVVPLLVWTVALICKLGIAVLAGGKKVNMEA